MPLVPEELRRTPGRPQRSRQLGDFWRVGWPLHEPPRIPQAAEAGLCCEPAAEGREFARLAGLARPPAQGILVQRVV